MIIIGVNLYLFIVLILSINLIPDTSPNAFVFKIISTIKEAAN